MSKDKWLTNLSVEELKARILPKPHEPFEINGIPVYKNLNRELLPKEIFKPHPSLPVEVSNYGRVKTGESICEQKPDTSKSDPEGYLWIEIPNKSKYQLVYRLVAETWCDRPDATIYNTVHHISNNGMDNRPNNLLWVTSEQHAEIHPWSKQDTMKSNS